MSDVESPQVSVLLPVYNGAPYIAEAIRSIREQSFRDFELLILDDGSTDGSAEIARRCVEGDARAKIHSRANAGLVVTLNELVAQARAPVVARMDADDRSRTDRLLKQVAFLREHPDCLAVGSRALFVDPEGCPVTPFIDCLDHVDIDRTLMAGQLGILHPSVMMRRDAVLAVGGYRPDFPHVEDLDLFLRLGEIGRLANLADVLLEYRLHPRSVSYQNSDEQRRAAHAAVGAARLRRGLGDALPQPVAAPLSAADEHHRRWGWWALAAGYVATARKHAARAVAARPLETANWRLLALAWLPRRTKGARPST